VKEEPVDTIEYRGRQIKIYQDDDPQDPRKDFDPLGTMVCFHSRYSLGDVEKPGEPDNYLRRLAYECGTPIDTDNCEMGTIWKILDRHYLFLSLYLYDHSGITMRCHPFSCPWDPGQIGWIYMSHAKIRENWSVKCVRHKVKHHLRGRIKAIDYARQCLEGEVETYDHYLTGNVYGYDTGGDSCRGYYGHNHKESGLLEQAESAIDCQIESERKEHIKNLKAMIRGKVGLDYRTPLALTGVNR
jgi:hypothetical protein